MARRRRYGGYDDYGWPRYVPVAERRARVQREVEKLRKKGRDIQPIVIEGRTIARTFWGRGWCDHIESFRDYENRLPRGRTYVRNGSVCHLAITPGTIDALVSGSKLYKVTIAVEALPAEKWENVKKRCAGQIGSLLELLQGRLSENVMGVVTDREEGLFPLSGEISLKCDCPDWAVMCKHVAAVLYGVGARLDEQPELLFHLRNVDHEELIATDVDIATAGSAKGRRKRIADDALSDVFGIEMSAEAPPARKKPVRRKSKSAPGPRKKAEPGAQQSPGAAAPRGPITGKSVARLRADLGMSRAQFARLLGVSVPSIGNWEKKPGVLNLQTRTLNALRTVEGLTRQQAQSKLSQS